MSDLEQATGCSDPEWLEIARFTACPYLRTNHPEEMNLVSAWMAYKYAGFNPYDFSKDVREAWREFKKALEKAD